jgi:hypothetical protein
VRSRGRARARPRENIVTSGRSRRASTVVGRS